MLSVDFDLILLFSLNRHYFVTVFSICYAIFLVVFGAIVFIGNVFVKQYSLPEVKRKLNFMAQISLIKYIVLYWANELNEKIKF